MMLWSCKEHQVASQSSYSREDIPASGLEAWQLVLPRGSWEVCLLVKHLMVQIMVVVMAVATVATVVATAVATIWGVEMPALRQTESGFGWHSFLATVVECWSKIGIYVLKMVNVACTPPLAFELY